MEQATGGRVGYIHIPDMGANGIREFIKWYYPQIRKEGLVVDVRANGGGNVSRMLIERLRRKLLGAELRAHRRRSQHLSRRVFIGPMVALLDQNSASDGDIFPYMFREAGLGTIDRQTFVGRRGWHQDSRATNRRRRRSSCPVRAWLTKNGKWIIEGYGVDPDIEVDNDPKSEIEGRDPQLERGIAEVMARLKTPVKLPAKPAGPVKTIK